MSLAEYRTALEAARGYAELGKHEMASKRLDAAMAHLNNGLSGHPEMLALRAEYVAATSAISQINERQKAQGSRP